MFNVELNEVNTTNTLHFLKKHWATFHLTGSRFFQTKDFHDPSDWDFFSQYDETLYHSLLKQGFKVVDNDPDYNGMPDILCILELNNAHVQLVRDANVKILMQSIIKNRFYDFYTLTKEQRKQVWQTMYYFYTSLTSVRKEMQEIPF